MIIRKLNFLILILVSSTILNCASFSKKNIREDLDHLKDTNLTKLNGTYAFHPIKKYHNHSKKQIIQTPALLRTNNAYDFIINQDLNKKLVLDSLIENDYQISLHLENKNEIRIKLLENSKVIRDTLFSGKHKNGMFYLNNKFLRCTGVPFLFGGCTNDKRRIGLTKNGNLLINAAYSNEGAFLLVMGAGYNYNESFEYQRK